MNRKAHSSSSDGANSFFTSPRRNWSISLARSISEALTAISHALRVERCRMRSLISGMAWGSTLRRSITQADEQRDEPWIRTHLATNGHADFGLRSRISHHLDRSEDRGVGGVVVPGDRRIGTISCESILNQVVRADGEEVDFLGELRSHQGSGGNLDHHADRNVRSVRDSALQQILGHIPEHGLRLAQFTQR